MYGLDFEVIKYVGNTVDITESKRAEEELYRISTRDPLTGLFNRRHIFERFDLIIKEYKREKKGFSLSLIDLDFFKNVNDNHGHLAGDFVLREFGSILSDNFRPYDIVGRYGGEEFLAIAVNMDKKSMKEKMDLLRKTLKGCPFDYNGTIIPLTFSAGVLCSDERDLELTPEYLINIADQRLYTAKEGGRDMIVCG